MFVLVIERLLVLLPTHISLDYELDIRVAHFIKLSVSCGPSVREHIPVCKDHHLIYIDVHSKYPVNGRGSGRLIFVVLDVCPRRLSLFT